MLSEKIINLGKSIFMLLLSSAVLQATSFICAIIISNKFGPIGLSKYSITQNTINAVAAIAQFGFGYTALKFISSEEDSNRRNSIVLMCLSIPIIISTILSIVIIFFSKNISSMFFADESLYIYLIFAACALPFAAVSLVQHSALNGFEGYRSMAWASVLSALAMVGLILLGGLLHGIIGATIGLSIAIFVRSAMLYLSLRNFIIFKFSFINKKIWNRINRFAIPAGLASLSLTPSIWYSQSLVTKHIGLEGQGVIVAALLLRMAISFIPQQLSNILLPKYIRHARDNGNNKFRFFSLCLLFLTTITFFLFIFLFIFKDFIITSFGKGFHADPMVFGLLMGSVVFEAAALPFSYVFAGREQMWRYLFVYTYPKDLALVVACIFLIPADGALGFAKAYMISSGVGFALVCVTSMPIFFPNFRAKRADRRA